MSAHHSKKLKGFGRPRKMDVWLRLEGGFPLQVDYSSSSRSWISIRWFPSGRSNFTELPEKIFFG